MPASGVNFTLDHGWEPHSFDRLSTWDFSSHVCGTVLTWKTHLPSEQSKELGFPYCSSTDYRTAIFRPIIRMKSGRTILPTWLSGKFPVLSTHRLIRLRLQSSRTGCSNGSSRTGQPEKARVAVWTYPFQLNLAAALCLNQFYVRPQNYRGIPGKWPAASLPLEVAGFLFDAQLHKFQRFR